MLLVRDDLRSDIYAADIRVWERRFVLSLFAARLDPTDMVIMTMVLFGLSGGGMSARTSSTLACSIHLAPGRAICRVSIELVLAGLVVHRLVPV